MRRTISALFVTCACVCNAFAGGEDFQDFVAECRGLDNELQSFPKGTKCVVELLDKNCLGSSVVAPQGYDVYVARKSGSRWVSVTKTARFDACLPESSAGTNRKLSFKVNTSGSYAVIVDGKGDGKPTFFGSVLFPGVESSSFKRFKVTIR